MNKEQAQEVKDLLITIHDSIPATHVDRIFQYYKSYIDPNAGKPCTCSPKDWNRMLIELRNKVEATLASYENTEPVIPTKRGRKKRDAGVA
jgi:hypothetical protein